MSIENLNRNILRLSNELSKIQNDLSKEQKREATKISEIQRINKSITKNTSLSSLRQKQSQIDRCKSDIARTKNKQAELTKKLSLKQATYSKEQAKLSKAQITEQDKIFSIQQDILNKQKLFPVNSNLSPKTQIVEILNKEYDFFISHASEDKVDFAEPLKNELERLGAKVWYDNTEMRVGDSLRKSIDKGLAHSKYGIVVLTKIYMQKFWTGQELNGLFSKWSNQKNDTHLILPIWHNISKDDIFSFSPMLADIIAIKTSEYTIIQIAEQLSSLLEE